MSWWVHDFIQAGRTDLLVSWIFWVIFSICLHELAHGWAAIRQGDRTPIEMGHMNFNPMTHMGGLSLLILLIVGIAWGLMPTDPSRYRSGRRGRIFVAGAGPALNVVLALVCIVLGGLWVRFGAGGTFDPSEDLVTLFLHTGAMLNLILAAFNLLPIPPLDGSQILMGFSYRFYEFFHRQEVQTFGLFLMLAILWFGLFGFAFTFARELASAAITLIGT